MMIKTLTIFKKILLLSQLLSASAFAEGDMTAQYPIEVTVNLGDKSNKLRFYPSALKFETGKLYKLVIKNPSKQKHYFSAVGLSHSVFTRKVQIVNASNATMVEVKGIINEIEVYPEGIAEWWFVPVKMLNNSPLHCSIKGHTEAGMTGVITIK
ncbi:MAG: biphenyl 2,3-dioxygenase [Gammaproteobacteria bacterium]